MRVRDRAEAQRAWRESAGARVDEERDVVRLVVRNDDVRAAVAVHVGDRERRRIRARRHGRYRPEVASPVAEEDEHLALPRDHDVEAAVAVEIRGRDGDRLEVPRERDANRRPEGGRRLRAGGPEEKRRKPGGGEGAPRHFYQARTRPVSTCRNWSV